jgi:hypothetical protein
MQSAEVGGHQRAGQVEHLEGHHGAFPFRALHDQRGERRGDIRWCVVHRPAFPSLLSRSSTPNCAAITFLTSRGS